MGRSGSHPAKGVPQGTARASPRLVRYGGTSCGGGTAALIRMHLRMVVVPRGSLLFLCWLDRLWTKGRCTGQNIYDIITEFLGLLRSIEPSCYRIG